MGQHVQKGSVSKVARGQPTGSTESKCQGDKVEGARSSSDRRLKGSQGSRRPRDLEAGQPSLHAKDPISRPRVVVSSSDRAGSRRLYAAPPSPWAPLPPARRIIGYMCPCSDGAGSRRLHEVPPSLHVSAQTNNKYLKQQNKYLKTTKTC